MSAICPCPFLSTPNHRGYGAGPEPQRVRGRPRTTKGTGQASNHKGYGASMDKNGQGINLKAIAFIFEISKFQI